MRGGEGMRGLGGRENRKGGCEKGEGCQEMEVVMTVEESCRFWRKRRFFFFCVARSAPMKTASRP
eukprot:2153981-Rhodomonas_salina.1